MEKKIIQTDELKEIQIDILNKIDQFCKENNLQYYLFAGTLIGAVRHKGYIPWDDDIDVCMLRKDYDKFFALFNNERKDSLKAIDHNNMAEYYLAAGKVINEGTVVVEDTNFKVPIGVYVDIFPLDNMPNDDKELLAYDKKIKPYRDLLLLKTISYRKGRVFWKNAVLSVGRIVLKPIPVNYLIKKIYKLATCYQDNSSCNRIADISVFTYGLREVFFKEDFAETTKLEFEGKYYDAPINYSRVLENMYGEYMKLPPKEKQIAHHKFKAYWK